MILEGMTLTPSQAELIPKMKAFLNGPDKYFLLTGKPGVGKTTMTKIMLAEHIKADRESNSYGMNMNVAGVCLAHQAKNVLGTYIPRVFTFAKTYGMKEQIDEFTGERKFVYNKFHEGQIIGDQAIPVFVHDEVSQYTKAMLDIVYERTSMFSKVIFMGDRAQLPPIDPKNQLGKDRDSPVFEEDFPEHCKHELTERVRQEADNPILELSDIIREEIFGLQRIKTVLEAISKPKMINGNGYDYVKYSNFMEHISGKEILDTRVIAFRNSAINRFNPLIRNHLMGNPDDILVEGDIVAMNDTYYKFDEYGIPKFVLYNSEIFKLGKIYTTVVKFETDIDEYKIEAYVANIEGKHGQFIVPTMKGQYDYEVALAEIADQCKSRQIKWSVFWDFKSQFCSWAYGYATTAYKSQGSGYSTIYLDINDVLTTKPLTRKRQLQTIYTAITRAKKDVYFLKS